MSGKFTSRDVIPITHNAYTHKELRTNLPGETVNTSVLSRNPKFSDTFLESITKRIRFESFMTLKTLRE